VPAQKQKKVFINHDLILYNPAIFFGTKKRLLPDGRGLLNWLFWNEKPQKY
jgi:hypothetical protein